MTEHEHAEISRRLALAIGWDSEDVQMVMAFQGHPAYCEVWPWGGRCGGNWKPFDYRDPDVIDPIKGRYKISSYQIISGKQKGRAFAHDLTICATEDTEQLAVAMTVIAAKEKA